jgi:glycosyltransferase involved in cell wall biosynthesis
MGNTLRVAINAQCLPNQGAGGIETALIALTALGSLDDGDEEYVFIGPWEEPDWLRPFLGERSQIVRGPVRPPDPPEWALSPFEPLKRALGPLRPLARRTRQILTGSGSGRNGEELPFPVSDGFYESLGCDVIHFPFQSFVRCELPSIFNPHDLLHLHYPEFFAQSEINWRERMYPAACHRAHTVAVASQFVKNDVVERYQIPAGKIQVVPWSPPPLRQSIPSDYIPFSSVREKYKLNDQPFALYPAMTWEHKNHLRLLDALALLRDRNGLVINVLCTGQKNEFWTRIERRLYELKLEAQVKFPGEVLREELEVIYREARFVVVPTLFEAASYPLFEAWQHNVPVACSTVTSLPEQAGDAALLFDPHSVSDIADALSQMATDTNLLERLRQAGSRRVADFTKERTARTYRAVYRRASGRPLSEEDGSLLNAIARG